MLMMDNNKTRKTALHNLRSATRGWLGRYWSQTDGTMSYLAVSGSLVMMVFGGIGVDMMHAELKRTKIQHTLDRAVLAAASLDVETDPQIVVQEYFEAMGMADALGAVSVTGSTTSRNVTADAAVSMPANFMRLVGVDTMQADGSASAVHAINQIEVSLVLDVSGSMGGRKIAQMKTAAASFIDTLIPADGSETNVSISVVAYNATVNMGSEFSSYMSLEQDHNYSFCAAFDATDFETTAVANDMPLDQLGHFDPWLYDTSGQGVNSPWCRASNLASIMVHSSDPEAMKTHINAFEAWGNTAIDLGMKWGTALLDPAIQPTVASMAADGLIDAANADRPGSFQAPDTMKFIIVMTDGQNTAQYDINSSRKNQISPIWVDDMGTEDLSDDIYSIKLVDEPGEDNDIYYWPHMDGEGYDARYNNAAYSESGTCNMGNGNGNGQGCINGGGNGNGWGNSGWADFINDLINLANALFDRNFQTVPEPQGVHQMTWDEVYARFGTQSISDKFYLQPYYDGLVTANEYNEAYRAYEMTVNASQADSQLSTVCAAARDQGIVVYAVGVEAPQRGLDAMSDCASSPSHYFDVSGSELDETFASIARTMQKLRLTQ